MSNKIRAVIKKPGEPAYITFIENDLKTLQDIVGGYIECVAVLPDVVMIINEEGKLMSLEPNFRFNCDCVVGTAVFVRTAGEDFTDFGETEANDLCYFIDKIPVEEPEDLPFV